MLRPTSRDAFARLLDQGPHAEGSGLKNEGAPHSGALGPTMCISDDHSVIFNEFISNIFLSIDISRLNLNFMSLNKTAMYYIIG